MYNRGFNIEINTNLEGIVEADEYVDVIRITKGYLNGFFLQSTILKRKGTIILFGGSDGSCNYKKAMELAKDGHTVLALYFFGQKNQQEALSMVPIEFIHDAVNLLKEKKEDYSPITAIGSSKGGELVLLLGTIEEEISNIVSYVSSSHVFQGLDLNNPASSWSYKGKEIPYISLKKASFSASLNVLWQIIRKKKMTFRNYYASALNNAKNKEEARIKIERFKGNLLLFTGTDDQMWDSSSMMKEVVAKRKGINTENYAFEGAGHTLSSYLVGSKYIYGGSIEDGEIASKENRRILNENLDKWHPIEGI